MSASALLPPADARMDKIGEPQGMIGTTGFPPLIADFSASFFNFATGASGNNTTFSFGGYFGGIESFLEGTKTTKPFPFSLSPVISQEEAPKPEPFFPDLTVHGPSSLDPPTVSDSAKPPLLSSKDGFFRAPGHQLHDPTARNRSPLLVGELKQDLLTFLSLDEYARAQELYQAARGYKTEASSLWGSFEGPDGPMFAFHLLKIVLPPHQALRILHSGAYSQLRNASVDGAIESKIRSAAEAFLLRLEAERKDLQKAVHEVQHKTQQAREEQLNMNDQLQQQILVLSEQMKKLEQENETLRYQNVSLLQRSTDAPKPAAAAAVLAAPPLVASSPPHPQFSAFPVVTSPTAISSPLPPAHGPTPPYRPKTGGTPTSAVSSPILADPHHPRTVPPATAPYHPKPPPFGPTPGAFQAPTTRSPFMEQVGTHPYAPSFVPPPTPYTTCFWVGPPPPPPGSLPPPPNQPFPTTTTSAPSVVAMTAPPPANVNGGGAAPNGPAPMFAFPPPPTYQMMMDHQPYPTWTGVGVGGPPMVAPPVAASVEQAVVAAETIRTPNGKALEGDLTGLVVGYLESETVNPYKASVPVERIQNVVRSKHPEMYNDVVGVKHNSWRRFVERHQDLFHIFCVENGNWRMRLHSHLEWEHGDQEELRARMATEDHFTTCLRWYLNDKQGSCYVDDFMSAYAGLPQNESSTTEAANMPAADTAGTAAPTNTASSKTYPLPARGDFVRFVRRHENFFVYNDAERLISLKPIVSSA